MVRVEQITFCFIIFTIKLAAVYSTIRDFEHRTGSRQRICKFIKYFVFTVNRFDICTSRKFKRKVFIYYVAD